MLTFYFQMMLVIIVTTSCFIGLGIVIKKTKTEPQDEMNKYFTIAFLMGIVLSAYAGHRIIEANTSPTIKESKVMGS